MQNNPLYLSQLIAVKICHDLASPVGAVSNGVEILTEMPQMLDSSMDLISTSSKQAVDTLKYLRLLYGTSSNGDEMHQEEITPIIQNYFGNKNVKIDLTKFFDLKQNFKQETISRICLSLKILADCLYKNGYVKLEIFNDNNKEKIEINAESDKFIRTEDISYLLNKSGTYEKCDINDILSKTVTLKNLNASLLLAKISKSIILEEKENEDGNISHKLIFDLE